MNASTELSALPSQPLAVSVKTACQLLGIGNTTAWFLIKTGRLRTIKIGRRRLVIYASLEALTESDSEPGK